MLEQSQDETTLPATPGGRGTIDALARCRRSVLQQAVELFNGRNGIAFAEEFDVLPNVSSLLMTSLEELKVAEEELRAQNDLLADERSVVDEQVRHYSQLFQHAPFPSIITDVHGSIMEVNLAASTLFRREAKHLEHKPLQALLPLENREAFRRQLARLSTDDGVADWRITFQRVGDLPIATSAAVHFVPEIGPSKSGALYWVLRVVG